MCNVVFYYDYNFLQSSGSNTEETKSVRKRKNVKIEYDESSEQGEMASSGDSPKGGSKQSGKKNRIKAEQ